VGNAGRLRVPPHFRPLAALNDRIGQRFLAFATMAGIAVLDQGLKWWAWRNVAGVHVDYGGGALASPAVGAVYKHPVTGALLDLLDSGFVITVGWLLVRHRRSVLLLISSSMLIGGWGSDLLDRLVMHYWTAPGSVRGVVDFIPIGNRVYNLADLFIIAGTPFFIIAVIRSIARRLLGKRPASAAVLPATRRPHHSRSSVLALAAPVALIALVGIGAANFGGLTAPSNSAGAGDEPILVTRHGVYDVG
jgi:lipoprotein signal peptidase